MQRLPATQSNSFLCLPVFHLSHMELRSLVTGCNVLIVSVEEDVGYELSRVYHLYSMDCRFF